MRSVFAWLTIALCGLLVSAAVTYGESMGGDPFEFSVFLLGEYTDNRDAVEDNEEDNFDFIVKPRMDAVADWERTILDFYYAPAFRYRSDPTDAQEDGEWYHDAGLNLDHRLARRLRVRVHEKFDYTENPAVEDGGSRLGEERLFLLNNVRASLVFQVSRQAHLDVYGRHKFKSYDDDAVGERLDEERADGGVKLWHSLQRTQSVFVEGRGSAFTYENPNGIERDFDLVYGGVGVENVFSEHLKGSVTVGWQWQEFDDPGLDEQDAFYGLGVLEGQLSPRTRMTAEIEHAIRDADAFPYASQEYTSYYGALEWDASAAVTLGVWGRYLAGNYDDSAPTTAPVDAFSGSFTGGDEDTVVAAVEAVYEVDDQTAIRLRQHLEDVDSDVSTSFTRNTTSVTLSRHF
ncbi:MAG: outer membrane beta-barrel protein [Lentisphaerae bacterium]|nr:outer membrane beta-barrel protein [Lentisphaerota bacterium]